MVGKVCNNLSKGYFLKAFDNPLLNEKEDRARIALADLHSTGRSSGI